MIAIASALEEPQTMYLADMPLLDPTLVISVIPTVISVISHTPTRPYSTQRPLTQPIPTLTYPTISYLPLLDPTMVISVIPMVISVISVVISVISVFPATPEMHAVNCRRFMTSSFPLTMYPSVKPLMGFLKCSGGKLKASEGFNCFFIIFFMLELK